MSKNYNVKQKTPPNSNQKTEQLSKLQMTHKHNRRKNEILNGFVFMIGIAGFIMVFMMPRDDVFNNGKLENSFSNSSQIVSNPVVVSQDNKATAELEEVSENPIQITGFYEVGETLEIKLKNFTPESKVEYKIHFGNGDAHIFSEKTTHYQYPDAGNFELKVTAKYQNETKQIFNEKVRVDEAIIVNSEAFVEMN